MTVLTDSEVRALQEALDDEHKAWAIYAQVIADFGPQRPFVNIVEAEARHIQALHVLFDRYRLDVPENPWPGQVPRYASVREACLAAVDAEIENARLCQRLLLSTGREDILSVFRNLQRASQERHLAAFERCADRGEGRGGRGPGHGRGPGGGRGPRRA